MKKQKAPSKKSKLEELKERALALLSQVKDRVRKNPRRVALAVVIGLAAGSGVNAVRAERDAAYELRLFASSIGGPLLLDTITVKGPSHRADGAICFREELQTRTQGCLKVDLYILKRSE